MLVSIRDEKTLEITFKDVPQTFGSLFDQLFFLFVSDDDETVVEGPDPVPVPGEQNPDPQEMEPLSNGVSTGVPPTIIPTTAMPSAPPAPTGYSPPPNYDNYDYGTKPVPFEYPTTTTTDITSNVEGEDGAGGLPPPPTYDDVFTDPHGYLYSSHNV